MSFHIKKTKTVEKNVWVITQKDRISCCETFDWCMFKANASCG